MGISIYAFHVQCLIYIYVYIDSTRYKDINKGYTPITQNPKMNYKLYGILFLIAYAGTQEVLKFETEEAFEAEVAKNQVMMVKFFAQWCGHCKALAPDYIQLAKDVAEKGLPCVVAEVDGEKLTATKEKYKIAGYPTIKVFKNGKVMEYGGERSVESMLEFITEKVTPPKRLVTKEEIEGAVTQNDVSIFVFPGDSSNLLPIADRIGTEISSGRLFVVENGELVSVFNETRSPIIIIIKNFDEGKVVLLEDLTSEKIEQFITENSKPTVRDIVIEYLQTSISDGKSIVLLYHGGEEEVVQNFNKLAKEEKGDKVDFFKGTMEDEEAKMIVEDLGVTKELIPLIKIVNDKMGKIIIYTMERESYPMTYEGMVSFYKDWMAEKIEGSEMARPPEDSDSDTEVESQQPHFPMEMEAPSNSNVITLDDSTFDMIIKTQPIVFVKFFAPWCGHCKSLAPIYAQLSNMVIEQELPYIIAEVDATTAVETAQKMNIEGYPTIKLFFKGKALNYDGGRTAEDMLQFIQARTEPPVILHTPEEIKTAIKNHETIVLFFGEGESELLKIGEEIAFELDQDIKTYQVHNSTLLTAVDEDPANFPSVVLMKNYDEGKNVLSKKLEKEEIAKFIEEKSMPVIMPLNQKTLNAIFTKNKAGIFLFVEENEEVKKEFEKIANEKRSLEHIFVMGGITGELESRVAEYLDLTSADLPLLYIISKGAEELFKYAIDKSKYQMTYDGMSQFVADWKDDKVNRTLKSEPIPEAQSGPVIKLVGVNYKKETGDTGKDVLVKFYAEWCGHCQKVIYYIYIYIYNIVASTYLPRISRRTCG